MAQKTEADHPASPTTGYGWLGSLGLWVTDHVRLVTATWVLLVIGLGVFAPFVEKNLSGAG